MVESKCIYYGDDFIIIAVLKAGGFGKNIENCVGGRF
jgi:hypothetical protein